MKTNPLKSAIEKMNRDAIVATASGQEETALGINPRASLAAPVQAVCRHQGTARTIRVTADLTTRIVTPLIK